MGPRDRRRTPQDDLFHSELGNLLDQRHPLVKLAERINWSVLETEVERAVPLDHGPSGRTTAADRRFALSETVIGRLKSDGRMDLPAERRAPTESQR